MQQIFAVTLRSASPLIMHNGALADPLNPITQELGRYTSKRKKTLADHEKIADLEFAGGLWCHDGAPCLPSEAIEAAIYQAASRRRAKQLFKSAVIVRHHARLIYDGPQTIEELLKDQSFRFRSAVAISGRRLIRTRPMFSAWSASAEIAYLPSLVNREDLVDILLIAGDQIGIGDYRPRFGRFTVLPTVTTNESLAGRGTV